jgi:hypothetical protein
MVKAQLSLIIVIVAVALVVALILSNLYSNNQTGKLQTPTPTIEPIIDAHITDFYSNGSSTAGGFSWHYFFVIEVQNNGTAALDLSLTFQSTHPYNTTTEIGLYNFTDQKTTGHVMMKQPYSIGQLGMGQSKIIYGYIADNLDGTYARIRGYDFIATLSFGDTVLDQASIAIADFTLPSAKIAEITAITGFYPIGGVAIYVPFKVTIVNTGLQEIYGSSVLIENVPTGSVAKGTYNDVFHIPIIRQNQTYQKVMGVAVDVRYYQEAKNLQYSFTLILNEIVLDTKLSS